MSLNDFCSVSKMLYPLLKFSLYLSSTLVVKYGNTISM